MNILITAGGTSERIDDVRKITNMATGRLGSLIADEFLRSPDAAVTYVCSENAALPRDKRAELVRVDNVQSLKAALEKLMRERPFDAVVHSMAVSDYTVKYSAPIDELAGYLSEKLSAEEAGHSAALFDRTRAALSEYAGRRSAAKISSDLQNLFLCLEKTPKVIGLFKGLQPDTILVGFKLLSGVDESDLLLAARKLMKTNQCDFVLANDKRDINHDRHAGILIGADQSMHRLQTKPEIAAAITRCVIQKIREKNRT